MSLVCLNTNEDINKEPSLVGITGAKQNEATSNSAQICQNCCTNLESFDEFQHRCREIQQKVVDQYQQTHFRKTFIDKDSESPLQVGPIKRNSQQRVTRRNQQRKPTVQALPKIAVVAENSKIPDFVCNNCNIEFNNQIELLVHIANHNSVDNTYCKKCQKGFKNMSCMELHLVYQHFTTPFECPVCLEGFNEKFDLLNHFYENHKKGKFQRPPE